MVIDPLDKAQLLTHLIFVQIYPLGFGVVAIAAVGAPARLYALPIRTSTLVALQLLQVSLLVAAEILVSTAALNALYGLRWPLCGPALFGAVAVAGLQAVVWLGDCSFWVMPAIVIPGAALGLWYKSHYGPVFLTHYWDVVTPLDVATLALVAAMLMAWAWWEWAAIAAVRSRFRSDSSIGFAACSRHGRCATRRSARRPRPNCGLSGG